MMMNAYGWSTAFLFAASLNAGADDMRIAYRMGGGTGTSYVHEVSDTALKVSYPAIDIVIHAGGTPALSIDRVERSYFEMDRDAAPLAQEQTVGAVRNVEVRRGGLSRTILGFSCDHYVVTGGDSSLEVWVAPDLTRPAHYLGSWAAAQLSRQPDGEFAQQAVTALSATAGMPLELHWRGIVLGHVATTEIIATEVLLGALPPSTFRVPSGFARVRSGLGARTAIVGGAVSK
jgi:hypothetical protein